MSSGADSPARSALGRAAVPLLASTLVLGMIASGAVLWPAAKPQTDGASRADATDPAAISGATPAPTETPFDAPASEPTAPSSGFPAVVPGDGALDWARETERATGTSSASTLNPTSTVRDAAQRTCSTSSVDGLSRQIIAEIRALSPGGFAKVPARANLIVDRNVFLYLDARARDGLLATLDAHRDKTMKVNSAFRTIAQQYLVGEWGSTKRCGVELAALPGESNHEQGMALDITDPLSWRPALEAHGFHWMGKSDRVHFDFVGSQPRRGLDVTAFQRLWNRHHGDDRIAENGRFDSATRERLRRSPAAGFRRDVEGAPSGG